jgi:zinc protease
MFTKRILTTLLLLAAVPAVTASPVLALKHWQTQQGVPVYYVNTPDLPMLDITVAFDAGSARDQRKLGIAQLSNALLDQGTHHLSANQIASNFAAVGAQYSNAAYRDLATVSLRSLTDPNYLQPALDTFKAVLSQPSISTAAFSRLRNAQLAELAYQQQNPAFLAREALFATLYPHHPYGHATAGTTATLSKLNTADVVAFYRHHYTTKAMSIILVGAINAAQAHTIASRLSHAMRKGQGLKSLPNAIPAPPQHKHIQLPVTQTTVRLGQLGIDRLDANYFPLLVANYALGGGTFVSRLYQHVREKRGLSYSIYSQFIPMRRTGPFIVTFATRTNKAKQALHLTKTVIDTFLASGPSAAEVTAAKQNLVGGFPLRLDSNHAIASALLTIAYTHLPLDYFDTYIQKLNAVTPDQAHQAMQTTLKGSVMSVINVGSTNIQTPDA